MPEAENTHLQVVRRTIPYLSEGNEGFIILTDISFTKTLGKVKLVLLSLKGDV